MLCSECGITIVIITSNSKLPDFKDPPQKSFSSMTEQIWTEENKTGRIKPEDVSGEDESSNLPGSYIVFSLTLLSS